MCIFMHRPVFVYVGLNLCLYSCAYTCICMRRLVFLFISSHLDLYTKASTCICTHRLVLELIYKGLYLYLYTHARTWICIHRLVPLLVHIGWSQKRLDTDGSTPKPVVIITTYIGTCTCRHTNTNTHNHTCLCRYGSRVVVATLQILGLSSKQEFLMKSGKFL